MKKVLVSTFAIAMVLSWSHPAAGQAGSGSLNDQLLHAAAQGNTIAVKQLLDKGANIEYKADTGETALILAAIFDRTEVANLLLARGSNIDAKTNDGNTALLWAAFRGNTEVVKLLLANGVNINAKNDDDVRR